MAEWPLGTPARPANFPQRNRLIAGLASGVLIVEAAMRSGSLLGFADYCPTTARLANEMGRDGARWGAMYSRFHDRSTRRCRAGVIG